MEFVCLLVVVVGGGQGCEVSIFTSHKPLDVFLIPLITGFLSDFRMVMSSFVKIWSNLNHTVVLFRGGWSSLSLYMRGIVWLCIVTLVEADVQKVLFE